MTHNRKAKAMTVDEYILAHIEPEGDYLHRLWRATHIHTIHGRMASGHLQGRLLKLLVLMLKPRRILEVGTFSGYSALCMAEGLKQLHGAAASADGGSCDAAGRPMVYTYEINDEMEDFTRPWIEQSAVADYIDFRIGDAVAEAPKLGLDFDMVFLDGDKRTYVEAYEALLPLVSSGGAVLADNTLWDGHVVDPAYDYDQQTVGIRRFNDHVVADPRVENVILPERDGMTLIVKR